MKTLVLYPVFILVVAATVPARGEQSDVSVTVLPGSIGLRGGDTQTFEALVSNGTSPSELASLLAAGWRDDGIFFYAPSSSDRTQQVFTALSERDGHRLYFSDGPEALAVSASNVPPGPPPRVVGVCAQLGAVGQWENITPANVTLAPPFTGVIVAIADPVRTGTVYATTAWSGVFRSTDCGANWAKVNTGRNGAQLDSGMIWSAVIDPVAPDTLYALTGYGPDGLWKSTNDGVDWDQALPLTSLPGVPGFVGNISIDPTNHLHLILSFHDNCSAGHPPVCFAETMDGTRTWRIVDFPASIKNTWGEGAGVIILDNRTWIYADWELYYTSDAGGRWQQVSSGVGANTSMFRASPGADFIGSASGVLMSSDDVNWRLIPNSGARLQQVIGDGAHLYAVQGFQPPDPGSTFIWSATYADPMHWAAMPTPGLPSTLRSGASGVDYDADHHVLYVAIQSEGLWRVKTE